MNDLLTLPSTKLAGHFKYMIPINKFSLGISYLLRPRQITLLKWSTCYLRQTFLQTIFNVQGQKYYSFCSIVLISLLTWNWTVNIITLTKLVYFYHQVHIRTIIKFIYIRRFLRHFHWNSFISQYWLLINWFAFQRHICISEVYYFKTGNKNSPNLPIK